MTAGPAAAAIHDESGDAGQSRATAPAVGANPPTGIRGSVAPNCADMYRVCSAGGSWSATTSTDRDDPMLWLFDAAGNQVAFGDDVPDREDFESAISGDAGAGVYYLAIAQYEYGRAPSHNADTWPTTNADDATEMPYTINLEGFETCETEAPHITTAAKTADDQAYTAGDWTNQDVTVTFACVDNSGGSGVDDDASTLIASKTVSDEGVTGTVASSGDCVDDAGNTAAPAAFGPVKIDKTGPVLTFTGERTYTVDEQIQIGCSATDALSGIAVTCTGQTAPAGSYPPGTHTITRSATDKAANQTTRSATFTVKATPSSICTLTTQFVQSSANYLRLSPVAKKAVDKLTAAACQQLLGLVPDLGPQRKAALVTLYKAAVTGLANAHWLTADQASTLKTLAGTL